jgi:subtilisin family serine protease
MVDNGGMRSGARRLAALVALGGACLSLGRVQPATAQTTGDPGFAKQWGLAAIGAKDAWQVATGRGITIAVVDSGVSLTHEDLQNGKIVGAVSCLDTNGDVDGCAPGGQDDDGHGTHVAGIAAANTDNGTGIAGVAPAASVLAIKVLRHGCDALGECTASGTGDDVSAGIRYAADHGADVINLSLGDASQSVLGAPFGEALEYAWSKGAVPVVAAGNGILLPSGYSNQHAVVVGALTRDGTKASYSNGVGQAMWALFAPGGEKDSPDSCKGEPNGILSTFWTPDLPDNAYACVAGTSMAAPHVSGALAVLLSSGLTGEQAVDRLLATADDLGDPGVDATYGAGALDLAAAAGPTSRPTTEQSSQSPAPSVATESEGASTPATSGAQSSTPSTSGAGSPAPPSTAPLVTLPSRPGITTPEVAVRERPLTNDDDLPAGPVSVAALMAAGVGAASGWQLIRGASWARRTPL